MTEEWRDIPGWPGFYQVSSIGRVRSLDRRIGIRPGVFGTRRGKILTAGSSADGYAVVWLCQNNTRREMRVSRLVCEAWHGPCPEGMECRHLDDDKSNNTPDNLRWGTRSENTYDKVRNGRHPQAIKTHCPKGHPYDEANTYQIRTGGRMCRTCTIERKQARRSAKAA